MIHTNELMLGNWVEYATGLNGEKRSIPMQVTGIFSDTVYLNFEGNEGDVWEEKEENLLGIPITEELLEKCGFHYKKMRGIRGTTYTNEYSMAVVFDGTVSLCSPFGFIDCIEFLHELQNAYFMLTKKHLEVCL